MCSASRALAVLLFVLAACDGRGQQVAAIGSPPPVDQPVGPVPGPKPPEEKPNPYSSDSAARSQGQVLFLRYNCGGCHGDHGGGGMGPSLRDGAWLYGNNDEQIFASIAQGRGHGMPAWGVKLPADHVWKLVAYIKTLGTPDEVEPPSPPPAPWAMP